MRNNNSSYSATVSGVFSKSGIRCSLMLRTRPAITNYAHTTRHFVTRSFRTPAFWREAHRDSAVNKEVLKRMSLFTYP